MFAIVLNSCLSLCLALRLLSSETLQESTRCMHVVCVYEVVRVLLVVVAACAVCALVLILTRKI